MLDCDAMRAFAGKLVGISRSGPLPQSLALLLRR